MELRVQYNNSVGPGYYNTSKGISDKLLPT